MEKKKYFYTGPMDALPVGVRPFRGGGATHGTCLVWLTEEQVTELKEKPETEFLEENIEKDVLAL